jgi:hypothetical protein
MKRIITVVTFLLIIIGASSTKAFAKEYIQLFLNSQGSQISFYHKERDIHDDTNSFDASVPEYFAKVKYEVSEITIGEMVYNGKDTFTNHKHYDLKVGENILYYQPTGTDKTYTFKITRDVDPITKRALAKVKYIALYIKSLDDSNTGIGFYRKARDVHDNDLRFNPNFFEYFAEVKYKVSKVRISEVVIKGDEEFYNHKDYDLKVGENILYYQPTETDKTYTININRGMDPNDKNDLTRLNIRPFDGAEDNRITVNELENTTTYNIKIPNDISAITMSLKTNSLAGIDVPKELSGKIDLNTGNNEFQVPIVSQSGLKKVYTLNIYREKSDDNKFGDFKIDKYDINNDYDSTDKVYYKPDTVNYTKNVPYYISSINLSVSASKTSKVEGYGNYNLEVGENNINVTITAENGDQETYSLVVNRANPSSKLSSIKINSTYCGTYDNYISLDVKNSTTQVNIKPTLEDKSATVDGAGVYDLSVGDNTFIVTVTAADSSQTQYTINVNRAEEDPIWILVLTTD